MKEKKMWNKFLEIIGESMFEQGGTLGATAQSPNFTYNSFHHAFQSNINPRLRKN